MRQVFLSRGRVILLRKMMGVEVGQACILSLPLVSICNVVVFSCLPSCLLLVWALSVLLGHHEQRSREGEEEKRSSP